MNRPTLVQRALLLLGGMVAVVICLRLFGRVSQYTFVWPTSGVELGIILPIYQRDFRRQAFNLLAILIGVAAGGLLVGMPLQLAALIGLLSCVDVAIGCQILGSRVRFFEDLKSRECVVRFGFVAAGAPLLTALLGAYTVSHFLHEPFFKTGLMSFLANSVGVGLFLPAVLFVSTGQLRQAWSVRRFSISTSLALALFTGVTFFTFWQNKGPFLFCVFPPMIVVLLLLGLEGAVVTSILIATLGWFATSRGHGPLWLMRSASPEDRLIVLQVFVWMCVATALPVGALLDERRRAERKAEESQAIYRTLLHNSGDVIILSSLDGSQRYASPSIEKLTGWTPEEFLAMERLDTFHPEDRAIATMIIESLASGKREHNFRYRIMRKDEHWCWVEAIARVYTIEPGDRVAGYVGTLRDITEHKLEEETWHMERDLLNVDRQRLRELASKDPLTALLNRRGFDDAIRTQSHKRMGTLCVLMIDVDFFKLYNDRYGHQLGDECLIRLAGAFSGAVARSYDSVCRLGGEEFVVLLPETTTRGASLVATRILQRVRGLNIEHQGSPSGCVTVSIGVSTWHHARELDVMLLLQDADRALYSSKQKGRDQVTFGNAS